VKAPIKMQYNYSLSKTLLNTVEQVMKA